MQRFLHALEERLLFVARQAGIKLFAGLIAALLVALGLGFVIFGVWQAAQDAWGPVIGAFALGGIFVVAGLLVLWLGTLQKRTPPPVSPPAHGSEQTATIIAIAEAFLLGLKAGKGKGRRKKDE